jgi:outer membrane protein assembly factor BamB
MFKRRKIALCGALAAFAAGSLANGPMVAQAREPAGVTTAAYGNLRDGWDPNEPALSPAAVQSASFGELFSTKLKGAIYAQPLVYDGDVIVTTEKAYAYAINATTGAIVWKRSFGKAFRASTIHCSDLKPFIGSTSTPVIEPSTGVIYLTTRLEEGGKGLANAHWKLQAISAATGEEEPGYPVSITGTPSNTPGVPFNESYQQQRPALLLLNGVVYIAFASDCDITPYRGIVVGVSTATHLITTMWSDEAGVGTGEDSQAGIWQSGAGLVSDIPGRVILTTGNGVSPQPAKSSEPPETLSESVVGLTVEPSGQLKPSQFFAPSNAPELDENDEDLGSGGPIALPTEYFGTKAIPHLVVQIGKDGRIFLINADDMGGYRQGPDEGNAVLQTLGPFVGIWGHPAAYGGQGGWVYVLESGGGGNLQALSYGLNGAGEPALSVAGTSSESFGYTSGSPLVTSNGTAAGSAVVWAVYKEGGRKEHAQLRAYAAMPTSGNLPLLWSAPIGEASKFATPTAFEGRVYVGTARGALFAYGPSADAPVQAAPVELGSVPVGSSETTTLSVSATRALSFTGPLTVSGERAVSALESSATAHTVNPKLKTAGPSKIPAPGTTAISAGVISVQQPHLGTAIAAGTTVHLHVRFRPDHPGPVVGIVSIRTSAGIRTVTLSGYGTKPGLLLSAQPLTFGKVRTDAGGKAVSLTFSNSWDRPETITGFRLPGGPFQVSGLPSVGTVLAPLRAITLSVRFDPSRAGSYRASVGIETNHGSAALPATGDALEGTPRLAVSATHIDVGAVPVGQSKSVTFYVRDTGTVPLTITRAIAPIGEFTAAVPLPEGITIESGLFAAVTVTFRPTVRGPATGTYILNGNDDRGYVRVHFTGTGT